MKTEAVKQALNDAIQVITDYKWLYSVRPGKDNTRNRKFPFKKMISSILAFRGGTLNREIMDFFWLRSQDRFFLRIYSATCQNSPGSL